MKVHPCLLLPLVTLAMYPSLRADTTALWLFDEQVGIYPSSLLNDAGPHSYFLVLGRGGELVPGKFGHALRSVAPAPFTAHFRPDSSSLERDGMKAPAKAPDRTVEPLSWQTATFTAAFLNGDKHLRRAPFAHPTEEALNLGAKDFTVEFWLQPDRGTSTAGVVLEIGSGPRGENDVVNRLSFDPTAGGFEWFNQPSKTRAVLRSDATTLAAGDWVHCAFVYDAAKGELSHFLNGKLASHVSAHLQALPKGEEDYCSLGRDATWGNPLPGAIDEMRISDTAVYRAAFTPPESFARLLNGSRKETPPVSGLPQLFPGHTAASAAPIELGGRRHLFLDDALIAQSRGVTFNGHAPRIAERVMEGSGWISVVDAGPEDIRLYLNGPNDSLAVVTSKDGVHFTAPDLGRTFHGKKNITVTDPATVGTVFIDPNGHGDERWKIVSGLRDRGGVFVYTSADGFTWRRNESAALPFWAGSAVNVFYDDQRQTYVVHNRSDYFETPGGGNDRKSVLLEVKDLLGPWPFHPVSAADTQAALARGLHLSAHDLDPWWLDNGPLAPGGFGLEYPIAFEADPKIDPIGTDVYNTRAQKYPWAEDAYVAFPLFFFHYHGDGPNQRQILAHPSEERGSGIVETQLAVSRDGLHWKRYPRPAYVGVGEVDGYPMRRPYTGYGLVRRGREIWQYVYTRASYHDPYAKTRVPDVIHRVVQRVDGFVSLDGDYAGGEFTTKPFRFSGERLRLNIDTEAAGYAQIGFVDENGQAIPGFSVDEGVYVNGDEIDYEVEWLNQDLKRTRDVGPLAGRTVRLVVRLRGSSLYALQFGRK